MDPPLTADCLSCRARIDLAPALLGCNVRCPECGAAYSATGEGELGPPEEEQVSAPAPSPQAGGAVEAMPELLPSLDPVEEKKRRAARRRWKQLSGGLWVVFMGLVLIALGLLAQGLLSLALLTVKDLSDLLGSPEEQGTSVVILLNLPALAGMALVLYGRLVCALSSPSGRAAGGIVSLVLTVAGFVFTVLAVIALASAGDGPPIAPPALLVLAAGVSFLFGEGLFLYFLTEVGARAADGGVVGGRVAGLCALTSLAVGGGLLAAVLALSSPGRQAQPGGGFPDGEARAAGAGKQAEKAQMISVGAALILAFVFGAYARVVGSARAAARGPGEPPS